MKTDIKTIAATVRRSTTSMEVVELCDFVLSLSNDDPPRPPSECPECKKRRAQTTARVAKMRRKVKEVR